MGTVILSSLSIGSMLIGGIIAKILPSVVKTSLPAADDSAPITADEKVAIKAKIGALRGQLNWIESQL